MTGAAIIWQALTIVGAVGFALCCAIGVLVAVTGGAPDEADLWDEGGHVTVLPTRPYDWARDAWDAYDDIGPVEFGGDR